MNWEVIGAISEIVGATAVVVSLIYVAYQIKQGTEVARTDYHSRSVDIAARFQDWKAASPENARIFRVGMLDFVKLTPDERIILDGILLDLVLSFKDVLEAYERGFMDDETYGAWVGFVGTNIGMPGARLWWEQARAIYIPKVRDAVDSAIESTPPYHKLMSILFAERSDKSLETDA